MKRKELIIKLMKEGLTEKTLVNMNDKQLKMLAERFLSEQYTTTSAVSSTTPSTANSPSILNIPKTDQTNIIAAKQQKKTFATYEGEMKENDALLGAEKKDYTDKEKAIKAANAKIRVAIKDGKEYGDYTRLIKKLNDGKLPESTQKIIDGKKSEVNERHGGKSPTGVKYPHHGLNKPGKTKTDKDKDLKEWVNKVVEKNIHPFTSKKDIMGLIEAKLNEQEVAEPETETLPEFLTYDAIKGAAEPMTKPAPVKEPGTKPTTRPTPKTPYRPGPGINPAPKAVK